MKEQDKNKIFNDITDRFFKGELKQLLPLGRGVEVIAYHPCGLIALNKPIDVLSHPNASEPMQKALLKTRYALKEECYHLEKGIAVPEEFVKEWGLPNVIERVYLLNRLDSPTSGVILMSVNSKIVESVKVALSEREVEKEYFAIVRGKPRKVFELWVNKLEEKRKDGKLRVYAGNALTAKTKMSCVRSVGLGAKQISLLKLEPLTGRTHQLRVQAAINKLPILGDKTYGDFAFNRLMKAKRLFLHSGQIGLEFEYDERKVRFNAVSKLPEIFDAVMDGV